MAGLITVNHQITFTDKVEATIEHAMKTRGWAK
jgi:hypothetical protein